MGTPARSAATRARLAASALCLVWPSDDLVHFAGLDAGAPDGLFDDYLAQDVGLHVLEPSAQPTYRRSDGTYDHYLFHVSFFRSFASAAIAPPEHDATS